MRPERQKPWPLVILRGIDCTAWRPDEQISDADRIRVWKVVEVKDGKPGEPPVPILEPFDLEQYLKPA